MADLRNSYGTKVGFALVYIAEAHAKNQWPYGKRTSFCEAPKTMNERMHLAEQLADTWGSSLPVLVDTMDDNFLRNFSCWPLRYFLLQDGKLVRKGNPNEVDMIYKIQDDVASWCEEL